MKTLGLVVAAACLATATSSAPPTFARDIEGSRPSPAVVGARDHIAEAPGPTTVPSPRALRGKVIVIDPGHQLGNSTHPRQVNRLVNAGGFKKPCNTTGTATNAGFPEATFTWKLSQTLKRLLQRRGATVYLTRHTNSYDDWGPCIDTRGRKGNRVHADAVISIHGDGADPSTRGFFVIRPSNRKGWTDDIARASHRYAVKVKRGLAAAGVRVSSGYGGDGYDVRGDLGTLNWSNKPIVLVELGNMRNSRDARHMTSPRYRRHGYARGLRAGITNFVLHR